MRRNMGRNRGNMGASGPLVTGHLQDIDMELELLKRKREMIEQQQQLLVMEQQFQSSRRYDTYDQKRYDEPEQHGSNRDYTHLYDNGPKHRNQFGRKRQADLQWQYEGSSKRTHAKRKNNQSQFNRQGQHGPNNDSKAKALAPLMAVKVKPFIGQKIANQKTTSKAPQKGFNPSKVSKPKASPAPNKIASQPSAAERKRLVSAANESVAESDVTRMLLPDRVPTQQVSGRLELALGAIMKNIKDMTGNDSPHATVLRSMQIQRVMKQAVRERIRTVMLGKVVGSLLDILAIYREEFPQETDIDIVNIALEAAGVPSAEQEEKTKFIKSDNPEDFFKINMSCLLESKLDEMFSKIEELYNSELPTAEAIPESQTDVKETSIAETTPDTQSDVKEAPIDEAIPEGQTDVKETPIDEAIPEGQTDEEEAPIVQAIPEGQRDLEETPIAEANPEGQTDVKETPIAEAIPESQTDLKETKAKIEQDDYKDGKNFLDMNIKPRDVKRVLPRLLKKYIPYIVKLLNMDDMYLSTKAAITMMTNQLALKKVIIKKENKGDAEKTVVATPATPSDTPRHAYNLPYYVKIMGRPTLPKKKVMQAFLSQFNPKSIKKHRTIHNLLFVGFSEKTDYDVMVAADGTSLGRSVLSIRVCTNKNNESAGGQNGENNDTDFSLDVSHDGVQKHDQKTDGDIISAELDGQITDLLSSIRKSDEEENNESVSKTDVEKPPVDNANAETTDAIIVEDDDEGDNENDCVEKTGNEVGTTENTENALDKIDAIVKSSEDNLGEVPDEAESQNPDSEMNTEAENLEDTEMAAGDCGTNDTCENQSENEKVEELKGNANASGRGTPSRTSARLANVTPSTIRTRRASRLTQN